MRLIDADAVLKGKNDHEMISTHIIWNAPTIDAVPIVRCKDCKFYEITELKQDYTDDKRYKPSVCVKGRYAKPRKENWYCADGVRRDEVKDENS